MCGIRPLRLDVCVFFFFNIFSVGHGTHRAVHLASTCPSTVSDQNVSEQKLKLKSAWIWKSWPSSVMANSDCDAKVSNHDFLSNGEMTNGERDDFRNVFVFFPIFARFKATVCMTSENDGTAMVYGAMRTSHFLPDERQSRIGAHTHWLAASWLGAKYTLKICSVSII